MIAAKKNPAIRFYPCFLYSGLPDVADTNAPASNWRIRTKSPPLLQFEGVAGKFFLSIAFHRVVDRYNEQV